MLIIRLEHGDIIKFTDKNGQEIGTIHRKYGADLALSFVPDIRIKRLNKFSLERTQNETSNKHQ
jgi:hypothetical protein